jgi:hypothetical protein
LTLVHRIRLGIALGAAVATVMVGLAGSTADAASVSGAKRVPPVGTFTNDAFSQMRAGLGLTGMKNQQDLDNFRTWLNALPGLQSAGFYEAAVDIPTRTMTLLWHGSSSLQQRAMREGARRGLTVVIKQVPYTYAQVMRGMHALLKSDITTPQGSFHVTSVGGPVLNVNSLSVAGYFTGNQSGPRAQATVAASGAALDEATRQRAGLPTTTSYGLPSQDYSINVNSSNTRSTDTPAFNGGGMIKGADGSGCTSGFAISINGVTHTTTARHCNAVPYHAWDRASSNYGTTATTSGIGLARILTGTGFYWSFDGAWNNPNGYVKVVNATTAVSLGSRVCTSGANSGVHCNLVVDQMNESFNDGLGGSVTTIRVHQTVSGQIAGAHGDSGGPVLIPNTNGVDIWAVGMLQGSNEAQTTSCGSVRVATTCSAYIELTSIQTIINSIPGAAIVAGP